LSFQWDYLLLLEQVSGKEFIIVETLAKVLIGLCILFVLIGIFYLVIA
jgi:hypothetical protein